MTYLYTEQPTTCTKATNKAELNTSTWKKKAELNTWDNYHKFLYSTITILQENILNFFF